MTDFGTLFQRKSSVGRFSVDICLTNRKDMLLAEAGLLAPAAVRTTRISGVVDTGATRLVLPADVVTLLGLPVVGKVACRYADGRSAEKTVVGDVHVEILGRPSVVTAVVEPGRKDALIGAFVLEELDLIVAPVHGKLLPRDPRGLFTEIETLCVS